MLTTAKSDKLGYQYWGEVNDYKTESQRAKEAEEERARQKKEAKNSRKEKVKIAEKNQEKNRIKHR
ncbi:MAG: hypothetical protein MJ052_01470 [Sphaerochaetaceae bacterium]|nr:hypothetical protein [Sphaerochaetaceae bacterium]